MKRTLTVEHSQLSIEMLVNIARLNESTAGVHFRDQSKSEKIESSDDQLYSLTATSARD